MKLDQARLARTIGATRQWLIAIDKGKDAAEIGMVLRALAALGLELDVQLQVVSRKMYRSLSGAS